MEPKQQQSPRYGPSKQKDGRSWGEQADKQKKGHIERSRMGWLCEKTGKKTKMEEATSDTKALSVARPWRAEESKPTCCDNGLDWGTQLLAQ